MANLLRAPNKLLLLLLYQTDEYHHASMILRIPRECFSALDHVRKLQYVLLELINTILTQ